MSRIHRPLQSSDSERNMLGENSFAVWFISRAVSFPLGGGGTQFSLDDINGALISWESCSEADFGVPELSAGGRKNTSQEKLEKVGIYNTYSVHHAAVDLQITCNLLLK